MIPKNVPRMAFRNNRFWPGVNTTIRYGSRWLEEYRAMNGSGDYRIVLIDDKGMPFAIAKVVECLFLPVSSVPSVPAARYFHDERLGDSPDIYEIARLLACEYSEPVNPNTMVTLLSFVIMELFNGKAESRRAS